MPGISLRKVAHGMAFLCSSYSYALMGIGQLDGHVYAYTKDDFYQLSNNNWGFRIDNTLPIEKNLH